MHTRHVKAAAAGRPAPAALLSVVLLSGCPFGKKGFPFFEGIDSGSFDEADAVGLTPVWPASDGDAVPITVVPELRVPMPAEVFSFELRAGGASVPLTVYATDLGDDALIRLAPTEPLPPSEECVVIARSEETGPDGVRVPFVTLPFPRQPEAPPAGQWWLPGDRPTNTAAGVLTRLLSPMGGGSGLALQVGLSPADLGVGLHLGTVLRTIGLPTNDVDPDDTLEATWGPAGFTASAPALTIDDPSGALVLHDLRISGWLDAAGVGLETVDIAATADLRAWTDDAHGEACQMARDHGRPCARCDTQDARASCLSLDARGLSGVAR